MAIFILVLLATLKQGKKHLELLKFAWVSKLKLVSVWGFLTQAVALQLVSVMRPTSNNISDHYFVSYYLQKIV